jgi:hypothetical protein
MGLQGPVKEGVIGEKDAPRLESKQMVITYAWWRRVAVSHVIVGDINLVPVLWSTLHSNVPSWWKYVAPMTLNMAGGELDLRRYTEMSTSHEGKVTTLKADRSMPLYTFLLMGWNRRPIPLGVSGLFKSRFKLSHLML